MEKTFDELIEEAYAKSKSGSLYDEDIERLMTQVREATKREDAKISDKYKAPFVAEAILATPTDRILITENE